MASNAVVVQPLAVTLALEITRVLDMSADDEVRYAALEIATSLLNASVAVK